MQSDIPTDIPEERAVIPSKASFLAQAAVVVMVATLLSRVFGFVREVVQAHYFGVSSAVDAYKVAFALPNLVRTLLADAAIASAFIPVFSSYLARDDKENAWKTASAVINLMCLILAIVVLFGMVFARQLIPILAPGFLTGAKAGTLQLALLMSRIMFPAILLMAVAGLIMGILNSHEHFAAPAVAPVIWNLFIIGSVVIFASRVGIVSQAVGVTLGSVAMILFQIPFLRGRGGKYSWTLGLRHPGVKQVGELVVPVMISMAAIDINTVVDLRFASVLQTGAIAALDYAQRLRMLPLSIFAVAVSTVLFPTMSKQVALNNIKEFKESVSLGIRAIFMILIPAAVGLMVLSIPIVRLVYQHGHFGPEGTILTASSLFHYSVGIAAAGQLYLVNKAFYSLKDSRTPMIVGGITIVVNYFTDWLFMIYLPVVAKMIHLPGSLSFLGLPLGGIALSTSTVAVVSFFVLISMLRKRLGGIDGARIMSTVLKVIVASVVMGVAAFFAWSLAASFLGLSTVAQAVSVVAAIACAACVYLGMLLLLKVEEVKTIYELTLERVGKGK